MTKIKGESRKNKEKNMFEQTQKNNSKQELLNAIQKMPKTYSVEKTEKSPNQILNFIEEHNETIESLAVKSGVSEREILLAIRDSSDIETRKLIAESLNTTYYSVFGK